MIRLLLYPCTGTPKEISNKAYDLLKNVLQDKNAVIKKSPMGKPYLEQGNTHFSISHTSSLIAIAISTSNVGIDIEEKDRTISAGVGRRFLEGSTDLCDWVHFEAFSKLQGNGITVGFSKMKSTPHSFCELEAINHRICICTYGDLTLCRI